jgi:exodeoxyribonuclease-3
MNVAHDEIDLRHPKANEGGACFTKEERESFTMHLESGFIDTLDTFIRRSLGIHIFAKGFRHVLLRM